MDRSAARSAGRPPDGDQEPDRGSEPALALVWILLVLVVLGILFLSLARVRDPDLPGPLENLPHAAAYATLTALLLTAILWRPSGNHGLPWLGAITVALCMIILGSVMEIAQAVVGRDIEVADAMANVVGILAALAGWLAFRALRRPRSDPRA